MEALGQTDWTPELGSVVCSEHMHKDVLGMSTEHPLQLCRICFTTDCKMYSMTSFKMLNEAYETLTGVLTAEEEHLPRYLCAQCAGTLMNCARFRRRSLRAHSMLLDIVRTHGHITIALIQSELQNRNQFSPEPIDKPNEEHFDFGNEDLDEVNKQTERRVGESTKNIVVDKKNSNNKLTVDKNLNDGKDRTTNMTINEFKAENEDLNNEEDVIDLFSSHLKDIVCNDITENCDIINLNVKTEISEVIDKDSTSDEQTAGHMASTGEDVLDDLFTQLEGLRAKRKKTQRVVNKARNDEQQTPEADGPSTIDTLQCDICHYQTDIDILLLEHLKAHASKKSYFCDVCGYNTYRKKKLICHIRAHFDLKGYLCNICKKLFKNKTLFGIHMRRHSGEEPFSCTTCNKGFASLDSLKRHMKIHTRKPHTCNVCKKEFSQINYLRSHLILHTGGKSHFCKVCKKSFKDRSKLERHSAVHSNEKPFSCNICKKTFKRKCNLLLHSVAHYGKKPYLCDICTETFDDGSSLKSHLKIHSPDISYDVCEICKKAVRKKNYKDHLKIHSDEKTYSCDTCKKTFRRKDHLLSHSLIHSDEKPYTCYICGSAFKHRYTLISHFSIHSGETPYSCHICRKGFRLKDYLKRHLTTHFNK